VEFYEVIKNRHSVRVFKNESIPQEVLFRILEAFRSAPSWANTQPWELVLVSDLETKQQLHMTLSSHNPAKSAVLDAPIVICAIGITERSGFYKGKASTNRGDWVMFDLGIATEHLVLAAASEGLGTVHVGAFDYEKVGKILDLPENRTAIELIPIGYPAYTPKNVPRKPLEEFVFKNKYGQK